MWAEGGHVDGYMWVCRGAVTLHWPRCMDEGMGVCMGHRCIGGGMGGCGGVWTGTRVQIHILAPHAATLRIAAWAWAWAHHSHTAHPWVRRVSDTLLCASPASTGV